MRARFPSRGLFLSGMIAALAAASACGDNPKDKAPQAAKSPAGKRLALLIGCTKYDHLPPSRQLDGPGNDVDLIKQRIQMDFKFQDIHVLREHRKGDLPGTTSRPTYANIKKEFEQLIERAEPGDRVFILMAGHGSQVPVDPTKNDEKNFEPDGLDEVFLPADVVGGTVDKPVRNFITDNDIRDWLGRLRQKGASIFVVFDCCHSGSMIRGGGSEKAREVKAEDLSPPEVVDKARTAAAEKAKSAGVKSRADSPFKLPPDDPEVVALYAAQSDDVTIEDDFPNRLADLERLKKNPEARSQRTLRFGLLTYTLDRVLEETKAKDSPTYVELLQRIQSHYTADSRTSPTPLVEGKDKDKLLFSDETVRDRPSILLSLGDDGWMVDAGEFHALTAGSILALFPKFGGDDDANKLIGHLKVKADGLGTITALVEPVEHKGVPAPALKGLAEGMRCRIAFVNYGLRPVTLAIDRRIGRDPLAAATVKRMETSEATQLASALKGADSHSKLFKLSDTAEGADWLIRQIDPQKPDLYLVPSKGFSIADDKAEAPSAFGPIPRDDIANWITERLSRIQRVCNLQAIADKSSSTGRIAETFDASPAAAALDVQVFKLAGPKDTQGVPFAGEVLSPDDYLGIQIQNNDHNPLDITVLFIDSGYGIDVFFPRSAGVDNRLSSKDPPVKLRAKITGGTFGTEHILVIAAQPKNQTRLDFAGLAQPTIERARGVAGLRGGGEQTLDTALGEVLQSATYGTARGGKVVGLDQQSANTACMVTRSWRVARDGAR